MRRLTALIACALAAATTAAGAVTDPPERAHSRVIVSATLNSTLEFLDASSLTETQPALLSRGLAPVRMKIFNAGSGPLLLAANHGIEGSLGMFDLSGDIVTEMAASPIPARPGSVGVDAANIAGIGPMAFVTNTHQALGGCGLPKGSVTAYSFVGAGPATAAVEAGTVEVSGAIPYAVAADPAGHAFVSTNCGATLDTIDVTAGAPLPTIARTATRATGSGPDGALFDASRNRVYVINISASSLSVFDPASPSARTTVPMPGAKAIDISFADLEAKGGAPARALIATSNGGNDTAGLVDRDIIEACIAASKASCPEAVVLTTFAGVRGGAPEGIAFDPVSSRLFVVNKTIGAPALGVIGITEDLDGTLHALGAPIVVGLGALGQTASQVPALIAFDVVVQTR